MSASTVTSADTEATLASDDPAGTKVLLKIQENVVSCPNTVNKVYLHPQRKTQVD